MDPVSPPPAAPAKRRAAALAPWRLLPLLLAAGLVIAAMLQLADRARESADHARQAQVMLQSLRADSQQIDVIAWRGIALHRRGLPPTMLADGVSTYRHIGTQIRGLRKLGVAPERIDAIDRALGVVYASGMQALTL